MTPSLISSSNLASFRSPVVALVLGLLPIWLFVGTENTKSYNGELVESSRFNLLGFCLAVVGLVIAIRWLLKRAPDKSHSPAAIALALVAGLVCLVQTAQTSEMFTLNDAKRLATRKFGWPPLPIRHFAGLGSDESASLREEASALDVNGLAHRIAVDLAMTNGQIIRHNAYSAKCYDGLDTRELLPLPPVVSVADRKTYDEYVDTMRRQPVAICNDANTDRYMGELADKISENLATFQIFVTEIRRRSGPS